MSRSKHLHILFVMATLSFSASCKNRRTGEKADPNVSKSDARKKEQKSKRLGEEEAKKLVLQSYKKIFSSLYFLNDIDQEFFHPPPVLKDELRATLSEPNSWRITNFPMGGTYFEARVDRNSGAVEWIQMGYASE